MLEHALRSRYNVRSGEKKGRTIPDSALFVSGSEAGRGVGCGGGRGGTNKGRLDSIERMRLDELLGEWYKYTHIQRIVPAAEETTVTQQVSCRSIKCRSRSWSQRGTKVNWSHRGDDPLLKPKWIKIATKPLPGSANREHRKLISVKTLSLGTNYRFHCLEWCAASIS